jgi:hypothetical protein
LKSTRQKSVDKNKGGLQSGEGRNTGKIEGWEYENQIILELSYHPVEYNGIVGPETELATPNNQSIWHQGFRTQVGQYHNKAMSWTT